MEENMLSKIKSISLTGLEGNLVEVQTDIRNGIPEFEIVGLPDIRVKESKKRIESAIRNSQIEFPSKKILIIWLLLILEKKEVHLIYQFQ